jgi:hypothetical protein
VKRQGATPASSASLFLHPDHQGSIIATTGMLKTPAHASDETGGLSRSRSAYEPYGTEQPFVMDATAIDDGIWPDTFIHYELGYIDLEQRTLQIISNRFGARLSPMT